MDSAAATLMSSTPVTECSLIIHFNTALNNPPWRSTRPVCSGLSTPPRRTESSILCHGTSENTAIVQTTIITERLRPSGPVHPNTGEAHEALAA